MDPFSPQQPDEGYSEDPLGPGSSTSFAIKPRDDPSSPLRGARSRAQIPAALLAHIANLSIAMRTREPPS